MRPTRSVAVLAALSFVVATDVALSLHAQAAAAFGTGTPGLTVSAAPAHSVHLSPVLTANPDFAGEPSVGVSWKTGNGLYTAGANVFRLGFNPAAGSVSWTDASPATGLSQNLDPILVTEPHTGLTLAGGDTGPCSAMYATTNDGGTWLPSLPCPGTADHPTVGYSPSATTPGGTVFYYCQQQDVDNCARSTDAGLTWLPGVPLSFDCLSLHGHLRGSADGTAYLPNVTCFDAKNLARVGGLKTTDDGLTWSGYTIPTAAKPTAGFDPSVATTPDNTLYEAWNNAGDYHPVVAVSPDHGTTWGATRDLASTVSPPLVAATFPTLTAGDNGRVAYSFLGTSAGTAGQNPFASGFHGIWYLYTSYTYDGGATWTTVRDTPTPVQYGEIDAGGTTTSGQRNLLDFIDSSVTQDGRVVVAFADGCLSDCEAAGTSGKATAQTDAETLSTHAWATVAYQTTGRGLFSRYDGP